jgi:hypothetical protein
MVNGIKMVFLNGWGKGLSSFSFAPYFEVSN